MTTKHDIKCILDAVLAADGERRTLCGKPANGNPIEFQPHEIPALSKRVKRFWLCKACEKVYKRG